MGSVAVELDDAQDSLESAHSLHTKAMKASPAIFPCRCRLMQGFKDSSCWEQMTLPNNLQSKTFDELFFGLHPLPFGMEARIGSHRSHTHTQNRNTDTFTFYPLFILSFQDNARCPIRLGKKCLYVYTKSLVLDGKCPHLSASDPKTLSQMLPYVIKKRDSLAIWYLMGRSKIWMRISLAG